MLIFIILASAHLVLVVVVIRVAPFGADGGRTTRITCGIGGSGCVSPRLGLGFVELGLSVCCFGKFERLLCILEFADALLLWGLCQYRLHHIPMLRDDSLRLHHTAHCNR